MQMRLKNILAVFLVLEEPISQAHFVELLRVEADRTRSSRALNDNDGNCENPISEKVVIYLSFF